MQTERNTPPYSHFNPVTLHSSEAVGTLFLGLTTIILLIALLRLQKKYRQLAAHSPEQQ